MPSRRLLRSPALVAAVLATALVPLATSPAAEPRSTPPPRLELLATATDAEGRTLYRRTVRLETLERADVRVVSRTASSVSVARTGSGASGPRATLRVRIVAGSSDVLAHVRALVPDLNSEGSETTVEGEARAPVVVRAHRLSATIDRSGFRFVERAVAAARLTTRYGEPRNALVELRIDGVSGRGTNSFPLVPGLTNTLRAFAG